jgi:hypothetical protein
MQKENAIQILAQVAEMAQKAGLFDLKGAVTVAKAVEIALQPDVEQSVGPQPEPTLEKVVGQPKETNNHANSKR